MDAINDAINTGVKISFYYSELNGKKKEVLRNDGKPYTVSPFDLIWDGDYYYLTGYCDEREAVRTYRVDRIKKQPELLTEKAVKKPKGYDVSKYTTEVFRMFSTDEAVDVTLLCDNCCMNAVVDKFGMKIKTRSVGEEQFRITVKVCAGPTFYRWVFGAGGKIVIESPIETRNEYREMLQKALNQL
ncbi:MAG: WYL domain-containing protein [Faecalimonas umbilicata]|uniref:helix-turn-helix transcriptional regulator n=1 Tax=Faecalimonas umbilicata TaxID=1912855 RepID=UPI00300EB46B